MGGLFSLQIMWSMKNFDTFWQVITIIFTMCIFIAASQKWSFLYKPYNFKAASQQVVDDSSQRSETHWAVTIIQQIAAQ
jgi:hypothetical protein